MVFLPLAVEMQVNRDQRSATVHSGAVLHIHHGESTENKSLPAVGSAGFFHDMIYPLMATAPALTGRIE
jgi:hypothetical protein